MDRTKSLGPKPFEPGQAVIVTNSYFGDWNGLRGTVKDSVVYDPSHTWACPKIARPYWVVEIVACDPADDYRTPGTDGKPVHGRVLTLGRNSLELI